MGLAGDMLPMGSSGGLDAVAAVLVDQAFAGHAPPLQVQAIPDAEESTERPGQGADPLQPRRPTGPGEAMPVDAPPVPKLRPLE